ncbi:MAG TPA: ABC transporter ATP-binding protein [Ramlibacter sp.]|nr:ABC transporter ATP-binding protein [Ramlibacter sp.]
MRSDVAISVSNLTKTYRVFGHPGDRIKQALALGRVHFHREFTALQDVSFEIKKGESLGIIGRNGSGKSTLLQLICGILKPTSGSIEVNGRISALLELGAGFNPEFTGRENVYFQAAVMGIRKEEMERRFDDVAAFADIGEFIDQPVRTYSSGMYVRLAFAVNVLSNPEIMIVDEALAVGDMAFQAKCITSLTRMQARGTTILFVSHDIEMLKNLCSRGVYLEHGTLREVGPAGVVAEHYVRRMREEMNAELASAKPSRGAQATAGPENSRTGYADEFKASAEFERRVALFRYGDGGARITSAELLDENLRPIDEVNFDQTVFVRIFFEISVDDEISCNYYILDDKKTLILGAGLKLVDQPFMRVNKGDKYVVTYKTRLPLQEGNYSVQLQITTPVVLGHTARFLDVIDDALVFRMSRRQGARIWAKAYVENEVEIRPC